MPSKIALLALPLACGIVASCSSGGRDASQARCERTFARMAPSPEAKTEVCSCILDGLEARGMTMTDTLGNDEGHQIARRCAERAGVPVAT
ncbi:hypothetical protein [Sphingomicrobium marinum]|uniref:hypothetical protein n=1 Tax=Sphingomicrobium marinum TaxID=1227950 RepID=UPI0022407FF1|nr:hypothetical protein [Sphingomicrobium marinum]